MGQESDYSAAEGGRVPKIGIALSGGGSRAIAFHLGCLRTLHQLGVLDRARVLSTVSGGSVIGAMYVVRRAGFREFEEDVRAVLSSGLVRPAVRTALTSPEGIKAALRLLTLVAAWGWQLPLQAAGMLVKWSSSSDLAQGARNPPGSRLPLRSASRTTVLRRAMDDVLYGGKLLGDLRNDGPRWVAVATELTTGSAFYFGRQEAGSYRIGKVDPAAITVAHAVAASAAYPLLLPALDDVMTFRRRDGSLSPQRITLTDGGIYDNLGLSPLWPDRDPEISVGVEKLDTIIACRAGYGLRTVDPSIFVRARMTASFNTVHFRAQNATTKRLFDLKEAGRLADFALPYLDQDDDRLEFRPSDLVRRAEVAGYPTDFYAMLWIGVEF